MSDQPLGRDRLGRLVYEGDTVDVRNDHGIALKNEYGTYYACVWDGLTTYIFSPTSIMTVDLAESPKRTNYECYFADLGTLDQVVQCSDEICKQYDGKACTETACPFCWWSLYFWADGPCLESFATWLEQEATL